MTENKEKYIIEKDSRNGKKLIEFTHGQFNPKLLPEMTYVGEDYLHAQFYHIEPGATISINTPSTCPASGVHETSISIFAQKEEDRKAVKSVLEKFLGFEF